MRKQNATHTITMLQLDRFHGARAFFSQQREHLLAIIQEWQSRRMIRRSLGRLSAHYLRDIGLTQADIDFACADHLDRPALRALRVAAYKRTSYL